MLGQIKPRLGRTDVMFNSFASCISNASEKLPWTPKMSMSKIVSQPRMLLHQLESTVSFKQLQCFANTHSWRQLNKQMDAVNSDMKFVNFTSMLDCNFSNESFAVNFDSEKLEGVHCIFGFPNQVESILPEGMTETLQVHFFAPKARASRKAHANFVNLVHEPFNKARNIQAFQELNLIEEGGNSSIGLKAEVPLPLM